MFLCRYVLFDKRLPSEMCLPDTFNQIGRLFYLIKQWLMRPTSTGSNALFDANILSLGHRRILFTKANDRWNLIERDMLMYGNGFSIDWSGRIFAVTDARCVRSRGMYARMKMKFSVGRLQVYMCVDEKVRGGSVKSRKAVGGPTEEPGLRSQTCSTAPLESVPIYIYIEPRARLQPVAAVYSISGYICVFPFTPWDTPAYTRHTSESHILPPS